MRNLILSSAVIFLVVVLAVSYPSGQPRSRSGPARRLGGRRGAGRRRTNLIREPDLIKPQLDGNMGDSAAPRRLEGVERYEPEEYTAPRPMTSELPGRIRTPTEEEKNVIAQNFFVKYQYTRNELVEMEHIIEKMQRNYGLPLTGELDARTIKMMQQPRCGVPDEPAKYSTFANREHWQNKDVTYHIKGYTPDMSQCQTRNAFKRAFRVWEEVTDLTFHMVDREDADIIIYFGFKEHGDGYSFDGENGLLAHAFTPGMDAISGDSHFDEAEFWTLGKGKVFDTYNGNSGGESCTFPFLYRDKYYKSCTADGRSDGLEWCSTTSDYDNDKKWAFCPQETLFTYGGNGDNDPCTFPFLFLGETYDSCTYEGRSDGYTWCSTTPNYDADGKWGFCPGRAHGTEGGNAAGAACKFPFQFEEFEYRECTTRGRTDNKLWCATTDNYDADGLWGFCSSDGYSLFLVAAHEFGHAIGLDHSNVRGALMYPVYSYQKNFVLPDDDKRGARDLYGGARKRRLPALRLEKCGGDLTETETSARSTTTSSPAVTPTRRTGRECTGMSRPATICERPIDEIMLMQAEILVFQGPFFWRVKGRGAAFRATSFPIADQWPLLRCGVDAAYQRPYDQKLVFFQGSQYYVFDGLNVEPGYPRDVTELGLPARSVVDSVVYMTTQKAWKSNKTAILERTYYFVGNKVYRANVRDGVVMREGSISNLGRSRAWRGLPESVDGVFRESLAKPYTIFVKGNTFYRYENRQGRLDFSRSIKKLFKCKKSKDEIVALPLLNT